MEANERRLHNELALLRQDSARRLPNHRSQRQIQEIVSRLNFRYGDGHQDMQEPSHLLINPILV